MPLRFRTLASLALAASLGACAGAPEQPAPFPSAAGAGRPAGCDSAVGDALIGQTVDAALVARLRQGSGAQYVRVLGPRDIVTLDYDSQRLNLHTDEAGVIRSASCG